MPTKLGFNLENQFTRCRLCLQEGTLLDSHLLPKSAYRYLRMVGDRGNPNPTFLSRSRLVQTSQQVSDYLLCSGCEGRFNERGERWCLRHCDRGRGRFRLREILTSNTPRWDRNGFRLYEGAMITEINTEALVYFGMSVFWRAAVHTWKTPDGTVRIDLGQYEEPVRLFLRDEGPFPDNMVMTVRISDLGNLMWTPVQENRRGFHVFAFGILGLAFNLAVGSKIPEEFYTIGTAPNSRKVLWVVRNQDDFLFAEATKLYQAALSAGR
jgi:hypothetical protein